MKKNNSLRNLIAVAYIFLFITPGKSQSELPFRRGVTFYEKVLIYTLEELGDTSAFVLKDSVHFKGAISIDLKKIFIRGTADSLNMTLMIIKSISNPNHHKTSYQCYLNNDTCVFTISDDNSRFIVEFQRKRCIYIRDRSKLENKGQTENQFVFIPVPPPTNDTNTSYMINSIDKNPLYRQAISFEESIGLFKQDLCHKILTDSIPTVGNELVLSITLDKEGKITKTKVMRETNQIVTENIESIIQTLPNWTPGMHNEAKVKVTFLVGIDCINEAHAK
jgi:hypothetical protein